MGVEARGHEEQLRRVLFNLIQNAIRHTPPDGSVTVRAEDVEGGVEIEVADTGVGIQPSELPLIFDRFYRGSEMIEARSEGSGLGLAIAQAIAEAHGGSISARNVDAGGAEFTVRLPAT